MTEFLHDVVRKQNLDNHMRTNTNNEWDAYFHPTQDPWSDIGLTELARDWAATVARNQPEQDIHYSGGNEQYRYQVTDSGELGGGPF